MEPNLNANLFGIQPVGPVIARGVFYFKLKEYTWGSYCWEISFPTAGARDTSSRPGSGNSSVHCGLQTLPPTFRTDKKYRELSAHPSYHGEFPRSISIRVSAHDRTSAILLISVTFNGRGSNDFLLICVSLR